MSDEKTSASASGEKPCPECGELVRPGLVRCWNCGAFMHRSLEQKYLEMQAAPKKIYFSPLPADADIHALGEDILEDADADGDADEDDFVLSPQGYVPQTHQDAVADRKAAADAKAAPQPSEAAPGGKPSADAPPTGDAPPAVSHSVATGGDALLEIAMREELESRKRKKTRKLTGGARTASGFIIFCPYGCNIEVKEQHRGMSGKCPKCRAPFLVPVDPPDYSVSKKEAAEEESKQAAGAPGGFATWLTGQHVHTVNPLKLKLKTDSLLKDFVEKDFAFSPEKLLIVSLAKKSGGLFGGGDKKKSDAREAVTAHLREGKPLEELQGVEKLIFTADEVRQMRIVQPASSRMDSMFHGVAVFGDHRIAVQLPVNEGDPQFVSFGLMQFREFSNALAKNYGIERFGADLGIPLSDEVTTLKCHYTDTPIKALKNVEWYKADSASPTVLAGWKCESCGLAVSEDARKKEKLGGANAKGLAKAVCPKCKKKFGEHPQYTLQASAGTPSLQEPSGSGTSGAGATAETAAT
ncbi:MAG: hypothetical protein KF774_16835 [Planctomyces sp.]|nr:hypothetical protein [Planctomyces sp.]